MNFMRGHWFDVGVALAVAVSIALFFIPLSPLSLVLWLSLIALFVHQFEEYRYPGYFPGMINLVLFASKQPDRYPLNTNTALVVNVLIGWLFYALAAFFGETITWLGIATILVSVGNVVAHTFLFNLKGKTIYNPGIVAFFTPSRAARSSQLNVKPFGGMTVLSSGSTCPCINLVIGVL